MRAVGLADYRWALPRISNGCHSNAIRAPTANPPSNAQLGGIPYHSPKLHRGPCNSVNKHTHTNTHRETHRQTHRRAWPQYTSRRLRLTRNVISQHKPNLLVTMLKYKHETDLKSARPVRLHSRLNACPWEHLSPLTKIKIGIKLCKCTKFSSVRYTLQHKVLRSCRPAGRGGFSIHADTVLWRWRTSASCPEDCSRWPERQRWNFVCRVPLLFSARPDLHVLQNGDRERERDSTSVCRRAGNMPDRHLGFSWL